MIRFSTVPPTIMWIRLGHQAFGGAAAATVPVSPNCRDLRGQRTEAQAVRHREIEWYMMPSSAHLKGPLI
jgi:hypothetical protein